MVAVFLADFVCCGCCRMDSKKWYKITLRIRLTALLCVPHWLAPHYEGPLLNPLLMPDANPPALVAMSLHWDEMCAVAWFDAPEEGSTGTLLVGGELLNFEFHSGLL
jgi:hypothetical protein